MIKNVLIALGIMFSLSAIAAEPSLPTPEVEFVDEVTKHNKAEIQEMIGEPTNKKDITDKTGAVVASIWHYAHLNTDDTGHYYRTTELDFIGDKVVNVIFSNEEVDLTTPAEPINFIQEKT